MGIREHRGAIEAILFASGEPVAISRIADVLEIDIPTVEKLLFQLSVEYENRVRDSLPDAVLRVDKVNACGRGTAVPRHCHPSGRPSPDKSGAGYAWPFINGLR